MKHCPQDRGVHNVHRAKHRPTARAPHCSLLAFRALAQSLDLLEKMKIQYTDICECISEVLYCTAIPISSSSQIDPTHHSHSAAHVLRVIAAILPFRHSKTRRIQYNIRYILPPTSESAESDETEARCRCTSFACAAVCGRNKATAPERSSRRPSNAIICWPAFCI